MKKTYKLLGGISGLLSGVLAIVAGAAFLIFLQSGGIEDGGQALGLVILSIFIIPALIFEAILAIVILGLSIGILASKNKANKALYTAAGVFEIIAGVVLAIISLVIYYLTIILAVFLITAVVCIVAAILTFVAKGKLAKMPAENIAQPQA